MTMLLYLALAAPAPVPETLQASDLTSHRWIISYRPEEPLGMVLTTTFHEDGTYEQHGGDWRFTGKWRITDKNTFVLEEQSIILDVYVTPVCFRLKTRPTTESEGTLARGKEEHKFTMKREK